MGLSHTLVKQINLLHSRYADYIYNIGMVGHSDDILRVKEMPKVQWLKHPYRDRWFADPFILYDTADCYYILVETYFYDVRKGSIGLIVASKKDFSLVRYKTLLTLPTHLSFPCFYRKGDDVFVYPESCRSGRLAVYRLDMEREVLVEAGVLSELPCTDAVLLDEPQPYILTTLRDDANGHTLHILEPRDGTYVETGRREMRDNTARGAGLPFRTASGRLIRPAQDCNGMYGRGLVFQEVIWENGALELREVNRLRGHEPRFPIGPHTYNVHGDVAIVDGYSIPNRLVSALFQSCLRGVSAVGRKIRK